jgi:hypothetical protein
VPRIVALIAALALSTALGWVALQLVLPLRRSAWEGVQRVALAIGIGLGLSSCVYFGWLVLPLDSLASLVGLELALLVAGGVLQARRRKVPPLDAAIPAEPARRAALWLLGPALGAVGSAAASGFWLAYRAQPHGAWDAFAMWNARARFFHRAGDAWLDAFRISSLFHPDYPALLPSSIARLWTYTGDETTLAPALVGFLFAVSTLALLFSVLAQRRGVAAAALAAVLLCGLRTVHYGDDSLFLLASIQLADAPLAFFVLGAVSLALPDDSGRRSSLAGAGLVTSLGAWCKNEGALLVAVVAISVLLLELPRAGPKAALRRLTPALLGAVPVLALVVAYKVLLAPPGDLLSASNAGALDRILDAGRYREIGWQALAALTRYGGGAIAVLAVAIAAIGLRPRAEWAPNALPALTVFGMGAGFLLVYLITPHDLAWHLESSKYRLLTQLWPATLLAGFLLARRPDLAFDRLPRRTRSRSAGS